LDGRQGAYGEVSGRPVDPVNRRTGQGVVGTILMRDERDSLRRKVTRSRPTTASTTSSDTRMACAWCSIRYARLPIGNGRWISRFASS